MRYIGEQHQADKTMHCWAWSVKGSWRTMTDRYYPSRLSSRQATKLHHSNPMRAMRATNQSEVVKLWFEKLGDSRSWLTAKYICRQSKKTDQAVFMQGACAPDQFATYYS